MLFSRHGSSQVDLMNGDETQHSLRTDCFSQLKPFLLQVLMLGVDLFAISSAMLIKLALKDILPQRTTSWSGLVPSPFPPSVLQDLYSHFALQHFVA